jgi:peptidoglycan/LPS O-acetylase OafA/YrhL
MIKLPDRDNNFDLLRLVFAGSVVFWHLYALSQAPALEMFSHLLSVDVAVKGFFVISGYLVMMSYERSSSIREYAQKRLRRIYPAYAAVVFGCLIAGALFTTLPFADYVSLDLLRYLEANLVFLNFLAPTLPGLFEGQPFTEVNGALWTLKIEVMYYAFVPVLAGLLPLFGRWRAMITLYVLAVVYSFLMGELYARTGAGVWLQLQRQLPGQLGYFLVGVALYYLRDRLPGRWGVLVAVALAMLVVIRATAEPIVTLLLEPLALGILVIWVATAVPHLGNFARFGDFSYGIYIIHFPVVQALVASGLVARDPWAAFWSSLVLVVALSALSWHAIERPFLKRHSHYRLAETAGGAFGEPHR